MNINGNNYSVLEIVTMLERKELVVNPSYQRGSGLWPDGPSSYFIDTILGGFPFPKLYMYEVMDRPNRGLRKEIVDGQQRIKAITRFYYNELALRGESQYAGKYFKDLDPETQDQFLTYAVSVDVVRNTTRPEILQMFRRMNAYTLPLNEPERRHSTFQGPFKWFINKISDNLDEFFVQFGVFTDRQILRMADAEFLTDCINAIEKGVVSTSATDLRGLYRRYDSEFPQWEEYNEKLRQTFHFISTDLEPLRSSHMMKPYALHSLVTALIHCRYGIAQITEQWGVEPLHTFSVDNVDAQQALVTLAQAHEAKEEDGPFGKYVWGCLGGTNRAPRRTARVAALLRALGADVPVEIDGSLA